MLLLALRIISLLCHTAISNERCFSSPLQPTATAAETPSDKEQEASPLTSPGHYASLPCIIKWQCHPYTWNNNGLTDVRVVVVLSTVVGRQTDTEEQIGREIVLAVSSENLIWTKKYCVAFLGLIVCLFVYLFVWLFFLFWGGFVVFLICILVTMNKSVLGTQVLLSTP